MKRLLAWTLALIAVGAVSRPAGSGKDSIGQNSPWNILPALGVQAKKLAVPKTTFTYFEHLPTKLHYFDDAKTTIYFDAMDGVVYISEDEGMNWSIVDDIPGGEAFDFVPHPFDDRMAFVLTRKTTHYVTEDRGHTWRSFGVPSSPSRGPMSLAFHADPQKAGYILYHGQLCHTIYDPRCTAQALYTKDAFATEPKVLLPHATNCIFAHSSKEFAPDAHSDLIFCMAKDSNVDDNDPSENSRLLASSDFFVDDRRTVDYGAGTKGNVIGMTVMSKFLAIAAQASDHDWSHGLALYVTVDSDNWVRAQFPHNADSFDYPYTLLGSGNRSLFVDLQSHNSRRLGSLFTSNINGTDFVEILRDTHRSERGFVEFLDLAGIKGGSMINYVHNAREIDDGGWYTRPELKTLITYDDGTSWNSLTAPARDMHNNTYECHGGANSTETCSLHLHLFSGTHIFPEPPPTPPGFIMAVGSVSKTLLDYEESDMYLSRDAGTAWKQVRRGAHKYAFGDQGNIIVIIDDEKPTDHLRYSIDSGESWKKLDLGVTIRAMVLTTTPAVTSHSLVLIGGLQRGDTKGKKRFAAIHLDFSYMQTRQCGDDDVEKWYAEGVNGTDCIMGHKQWFWRKKSGVDCYMGDKYKDSVSDVEHCLCTDADYGCDYNYSREGSECLPIGPEPIPAGACTEDDATYQGSSGYRLLAGNTCKREGGVRKDEPVTKDCTETPPDEGEVSHQTFTFASRVMSYYYLGSKSILIQLWNGAIWQSTDEGYTWRELIPGLRFPLIYIHPYADERAYILTDAGYYYVTGNGGHAWSEATSPLPAALYRPGSLAFHPKNLDYLIWTGEVDCHAYDEGEKNCHVESYLSLDHGGSWRLIETYVSQCIFAETVTSTANEGGILCASYHDKSGPQYRYGSYPEKTLELVIGANWYENKKILFDQIIGFDIFGDYLVVAALAPNTYALDLQISLAGNDFVPAKLPPGIQLRRRDFTEVLQSSPNAIFLQEGISGEFGIEWGTLLKSNANGTYYGVSLERVNGNKDHEIAYYRMPGVDGVARVNILTNPDEAIYTGKKKLQTRITHNDGGSWHPLKPPSRDSNGALYPCDDNTECALHLHGPKYSFDLHLQHSSSATGLMLAVGNVGEFLAPREESDMFLTRNAGITWEEVHKGAHIWAFGDSGSILVIANHEQPTDHVQYTTDHGLHWKEYNFGIELRVETLTSDPEGNSRKFALTGWSPAGSGWEWPSESTVVYLNFAELNPRQCVLDVNDPANSDFEVWDPSKDHGECLLGAKTAHYRKKRSAKCYIGDLVIPPATVEGHCECTEADFECEFNHVRDSAGKCVLVPGAVSLSSENTCIGDGEFWYERTAYRKISKSLCENGNRLDQGTAHHCHGHWFKTFVSRFWWTFITLPVGIIALLAVWYYRRRGPRRGAIHLPDSDEAPDSLSPFRAKLASIPSVVAEGMANFWNYLKSFPGISMSLFGSRRRTQEVALEDDA